MAVCDNCDKEMKTADGCIEDDICFPADGDFLPQIPYTEEDRFHFGDSIPAERCHDCNCKQGEFHHPGCDMEECPRCNGQLISCGCLYETPS